MSPVSDDFETRTELTVHLGLLVGFPWQLVY